MKIKKYLFKLIYVCLIFNSVTVLTQVRLPRLINDGMVLQRGTEVRIWGWSSPNESITLQFMDSSYHTVAGNSGEWEIRLKNLEPGGPYKMKIEASNVIEISDVLIGDVWLCSGQSNMELPISRVSWVYHDEIKNYNNNYIRQFRVPYGYDFNKQHDDYLSGSWKAANSDNIMDFSAVAFFYAKEISSRYHVPIGLINASMGGSPAEAWMSEDALKDFPTLYDEMQRFKDSALITQIINSDNKRIAEWYNKLNQKDEAYKDKNGIWYQPELSCSDWNETQIPGYWQDNELENINGVVWYRRNFIANTNMKGKPALLLLGRIVDADSVFINGQFVGATGYQYPPRRYKIPPGLLKSGENTIAVRVISNQGVGGFVPDKPYEIIIDSDKIDLKGVWQYKVGAVMEPLTSQTFIRWKPGGLFNSMISPVLNYRIKGAIWYQGESNASRPVEYSKLLPALIEDWRKNWSQGDFPFIYVQLHNFMEAKSTPSESDWALLREGQLKTLSIPNTAMAVAIDLGEWNDIHPLNKKDVGYRLSLAARKIAYGDENIVYSGPIYSSMRINDKKIILSFTNIGSGLIFKEGNSTMQFALAGADKKFVWASAKIKDNRIIVWSDEVPKPVAVRYAWADNPDNASLYNKEGLPASPFRTDNWVLKKEE